MFQLLAKEPSSEPGSPETYGDFDYQVKPALKTSLLLPSHLFYLNSLWSVLQSRKYYFLSEEADEKEDLSRRCRDLEHQVCSLNACLTCIQSSADLLYAEHKSRLHLAFSVGITNIMHLNATKWTPNQNTSLDQKPFSLHLFKANHRQKRSNKYSNGSWNSGLWFSWNGRCSLHITLTCNRFESVKIFKLMC